MHPKIRMKVVAFIHAKGSSERVPSKNLRVLGDRPLFCHAIAIAQNAALVDEVVIDSDSDEILAIGKKYGATPLKRPADLATNLTTGDDLAYWQASNRPDSIIVAQVIPTAPFLRSASVDKAIREILASERDSVAGVYSEPMYLWKEGKPAYFLPDGRIPNSFAMAPVVFETTGLYVNRTRFVLRHKKRMNPENCLPILLDKMESIDINTQDDFSFAQVVWQGLHPPY